ncbi:thioredoxin domain-containing protein [Acidocella sp.]|uniref:thioredoxin domain-containing protein n=1 Tax=Acidocella sp. TaxID=50710 RepID=UPI0026106118|nr:thioredoxin domain-containing protein [Acidocella sp.]
MQISRRSILSLAGAAALAPRPSRAAAALPPTETERSIGAATAPVTVMEFFSLTCTHCAEFATDTMPQIKANLVDTGKVKLIFNDFPLDQIALKAAQVSRYLPVSEYYPFIEALFASQNDWAFRQGVDYETAIFKYAALAGMDHDTYEKAWNDAALGQWILDQQKKTEKAYNINATPSFVVAGKTYSGAMPYDDFAALVAKAAKG